MTLSHPIRVLYVEDDAAAARLLQRRLNREGYAVDLAYDGEEGLEKWGTGTYDLLAIDHDMPRKKGLDVIRELVSIGPLPPTIMITGHGNENIAVEAMKLGVDDYIMRDSESRYLELVSQRIDEALKKRRLLEEKLQAEKDLEDNREMLATILGSSPYIMLLVNQEGRVETINRAGEELGGRPTEELIGLLGGEVFSCVNSFDGAGCGTNAECTHCPVRTRVTHTFQTGEGIDYGEGRLTIRTGSDSVPLDLLISTALVQVRDKDMVLVTICDVTERRKATVRIKASLREKERLLQDIHGRVKDSLALIHQMLILRSENALGEAAQTILEGAKHGPVKVFFLEEYVWWEYEEVGGDDGGTATEKRGKGVAMWAKRGLLGWMQARLRRREIDPGLLCCSGGDATGRSA